MPAYTSVSEDVVDSTSPRVMKMADARRTVVPREDLWKGKISGDLDGFYYRVSNRALGCSVEYGVLGEYYPVGEDVA